MRYRLREGLICETVCGKPLLVATLKARRYCPYLTELNESSVYVVKLLEEGLDTDEMTLSISRRYEIDQSTAASTLKACLDALQSSHFIFPLKDTEL